MTSAVIFDCFGVLTSDAWLPFKARHFGHDDDLTDQASSLSKQSDAGFITYNDFICGVADLAGMSHEQAYKEIEGNIANDPLFAYIQTLKPKYKIGFLSNASANLLDSLFSDEQANVFDALSISYETGFVKPDERAYQDIADKLGVPMEDCVLVDDIKRNCTAAKEAGMPAIQYRTLDQTIADLQKLLGV
jgi:HAD superfamily hydrolase (TIGR01509 family)